MALLAFFVYLLTKALQVLPVGTAYAVWTGFGAAGTVVAGIALFSEPLRRCGCSPSRWWSTASSG